MRAVQFKVKLFHRERGLGAVSITSPGGAHTHPIEFTAPELPNGGVLRVMVTDGDDRPLAERCGLGCMIALRSTSLLCTA